MPTVKELAKMIDHSLLHPTMTDDRLKQECRIAKKYDVASVCIKPYAVREAGQWLRGSDVRVCTVIGFPHGSSAIEIKVYETQKGANDGATEFDMVINIGKVLQQDWRYIEREIAAVHACVLSQTAILKVIFENDFLTDDKLKIRLCQICSEQRVAFIKTSTGYGFVKGADDRYSYAGATEHDLMLMRKHAAPGVQIKAAGGIRTLDDLLKVRSWGVTRVGATATAAILEEAKRRF